MGFKTLLCDGDAAGLCWGHLTATGETESTGGRVLPEGGVLHRVGGGRGKGNGAGVMGLNSQQGHPGLEDASWGGGKQWGDVGEPGQCSWG